MEITTPLPLEQSTNPDDVELAKLIKYMANEYQEDKTDLLKLRAWEKYKKDNPYIICNGCGLKLKWCKCEGMI